MRAESTTGHRLTPSGFENALATSKTAGVPTSFLGDASEAPGEGHGAEATQALSSASALAVSPFESFTTHRSAAPAAVQSRAGLIEQFTSIRPVGIPAGTTQGERH